MTLPTAAHRRHVLTAPTLPATVTLARRTGEQTWTAWGVAPTHLALGQALLILTELVTNSVRHAAPASPSLDVIYAHADGVLAFGVHDRHPFLPRFTPTTDRAARGLDLIAELVNELGGTHIARPDIDERGKTIWITLPM
ncbi:MAG TPA: ATP-binding protein [Yinghuangia sp.]|nr:ATP-binding protein [Yinghuangia sp.]